MKSLTKAWKTTALGAVLVAAGLADLWYFESLEAMYIGIGVAVGIALIIAPKRVEDLIFKKAGEGEKK